MIEKQMYERKMDSVSIEGRVRELEEFVQFLKIGIERGKKDEPLLLKS